MLNLKAGLNFIPNNKWKLLAGLHFNYRSKIEFTDWAKVDGIVYKTEGVTSTYHSKFPNQYSVDFNFSKTFGKYLCFRLAIQNIFNQDFYHYPAGINHHRYYLLEMNLKI